MNILVTGGTGFVGEYFIPLLLEGGHKVRLLVRDLKKARNLFFDSCEYFVGDITDVESLRGCCDNIDLVFHMVAKVGNELPNEENFALFRSVNVNGTANIIAESKFGKIKKFVFVSTIAAMGIVKQIPISEKSKCEPFLPYQVSKYEAEELVREEFKIDGFPGICIRPTKVYGIGEHEYSYLTLAKMCNKRFFFKVGNGTNYTSNIYITDLAKGLFQMIENGELGETYILTSNDSIGFVESGKLIADVLKKQIICIPIPSKLMILLSCMEEKILLLMGKKPIVTKRNVEATILDRVYDISKAKKDLNFNPEVSLRDGITRTVTWYKEQGIV